MRHIMVLNAKGGSGKTTITTNLASYLSTLGYAVGLADFDPQGSSLAWLAERSAARPSISGIAGFQKGYRAPRNLDYLIMDAPAAVHGKDLTALMRKAETIIVPVLPSPIDMRAATDFITELKKNSRVANKQAKIALVANRTREVTRIYGELEAFLKKQRIPVLTHLRDSQNYIRSAEKGLGIFEMAPSATRTDRELWQPIVKWIKSKRSQP
jgi:chromosome partitioning protein